MSITADKVKEILASLYDVQENLMIIETYVPSSLVRRKVAQSRQIIDRIEELLSTKLTKGDHHE